MSHSTYNKLWADAHFELNSLLIQELPAQPARPEKDRVVFYQRLATLYVRYVQIFRRIEEAYDQITHPQKKRVIRQVLDGVMGRVVELKNEMVEKEFSEYHYMDDVIQDLKLTPEAIEIPIPKYFISERKKVLQDRAKMLSDILDIMGVVDNHKPIRDQTLSLEEAIRVIQVAERARQGRLRAKFMRQIQRDEERQRRAKDRNLGADAIDQAVVRIQKVWKGFVQRKKTKREREEEMIFLGMVMGAQTNQPCSYAAAVYGNKARRRQKQSEYEEDYLKAITTITDKIRDLEGPDIKETMKDQIRQWFIECHDATGSFPDYPEEEDGGSALIFAEKTPQQLMEELAAKEEEDANKKPKGKEEKKDKAKKDKGKGGEEEEEPGLKMLPSAFLEDLEAGQKTYNEVWQNRDESKNFSQRHEGELIKEEKRKEVEAEIRLQVDELMRQELANWKLAVDKDKGGKAKGNAKKKKGAKSAKKKKKDKDLTADRTMESLFQELVQQGLLKQADDVKLKNYLGDYSYLGTTLRQSDIEPMPSLSDVRQLMALYGILPLGSQIVHEKAPLIKAMLLAGPAGVGKKMLVHAICKETGANLFDLSPLNLVGKYPGKSGLQMMLHMVFKVARALQPSVVWIGDAEKMFYKKVPKEEKELDPKRLKKDLPKILKTIKGEDRVLIIGTTREPFNADIKALSKVYSKIILIPRPDYASRYMIWRQLIENHGGQVTSTLDFSSLAKISDGYTQGHMVQVVRSILTERRIQQQAKRPLMAAEFITPLAKIDPVFQDEEEALKAWYAKTPLGKKRAKAASGKEGEEEAPAKGGKDAKKKKK
ncbi:dynein regulatory complex protein 11 isoform X1 [Alosa sapidissima]|uniref:dynein regulatory complex protein 11 isoform X1 n=1 Tax=Alosa sapidissima TaxID=34773 RepID=UPI001C09A590|nr:dynein regulatory complex protein 11 isoform X1 [Alosa sapidissima]